jgi:hypothetical protein
VSIGEVVSSVQSRAAIEGGLRLLAWSLPAGLLAVMAAERLLVPTPKGGSTPLVSGSRWLLLVPGVAAVVGLSVLALQLGLGGTRRWIYRTGVAVIVLLVASAVDLPSLMVELSAPIRGQYPGWEVWAWYGLSTAVVGTSAVLGALGCAVLKRTAAELGLERVGGILRSCGLALAVLMTLGFVWSWCVAALDAPTAMPFGAPSPPSQSDVMTAVFRRSAAVAQSAFKFAAIGLPLAAWAAVLLCRHRLGVLAAGTGTDRS